MTAAARPRKPPCPHRSAARAAFADAADAIRRGQDELRKADLGWFADHAEQLQKQIGVWLSPGGFFEHLELEPIKTAKRPDTGLDAK